MALKRMDNVGIVVENLDETIGFFVDLGLELEGPPQLKVSGQGALPDSPINVWRLP